MRFAVLPAAGKSTRMGRPKLTLHLGDSTVIEQVVRVLFQAKVTHPLVVTGPRGTTGDDVRALAERAGAHVLQLGNETPDMRATVEAGLRWLEERFHPTPDEGWLLIPADHPTLDADVIGHLVEMQKGTPSCSIFVPTHEGKRGHPALLAWHHVAGMLAHPLGEGLNTYLRQHAHETCEVPVSTREVLCDLDTPDDYTQLQQRFAQDT